MTTETTDSIKRLRDRINSLRSKLAQESMFDLEGLADEAMEEVLTLETAIRTAPTKGNDALIARVRDALKIDLREMDAIFTPLLTDVIAALEESEFPDNGKVTPFQRRSLMYALGAPGTSPSEGQVVADAMDRMEKAPPSCLSNYHVRGDRATFMVKDAVASADEYGFRLAEDVGYGSIQAIAKVIMLHITRVFGVTAVRMEESGSREGGLIIEFNRELTEDETTKLAAFLGV